VTGSKAELPRISVIEEAGGMHLAKWIAVIAPAFALGGCFDLAPKLSQEDERLFEAVTYLFSGLEDNLDDTDGKGMRWQRTVKMAAYCKREEC
jgi:hypothetical protein